MMKHLPIVLRALSIFLAVTFIEAAQTFKDVGAAKMKDFVWADWMILLVSIGAVGFVSLNAFFSTQYAQHIEKMKEVKEEEKAVEKAEEKVNGQGSSSYAKATEDKEVRDQPPPSTPLYR